MATRAAPPASFVHSTLPRSPHRLFTAFSGLFFFTPGLFPERLDAFCERCRFEQHYEPRLPLFVGAPAVKQHLFVLLFRLFTSYTVPPFTTFRRWIYPPPAVGAHPVTLRYPPWMGYLVCTRPPRFKLPAHRAPITLRTVYCFVLLHLTTALCAPLLFTVQLKKRETRGWIGYE